MLVKEFFISVLILIPLLNNNKSSLTLRYKQSDSISIKSTLGSHHLLDSIPKKEAQQDANDTFAFSDNVSCEWNKSVLAKVASLVDLQSKDNVIILVATLGQGERGTLISQMRLKKTSTYLQNIHNIEIRRIVTTVSSVKGAKGRLDIYLQGIHEARFEFKKKQGIKTGCPDQ